MKRLLSVVAGLAFVSGGAGAQGTAITTASITGGMGCGSVSGAASASTSCLMSTAQGYPVTASAQSTPSVVSASTSVTFGPFSGGVPFQADAQASASYENVFFVQSAGAAPVNAIFTLAVNSSGAIDQYVYTNALFSTSSAGGIASARFSAFADGVWNYANSHSIATSGGTLTPVGTPTDGNWYHDGVYQFIVPFTGGNLRVFTDASLSSTWNDAVTPAGMASSYMQIQNIEFFDATGGSLNGVVSMSSVPEPTAFALLAPALLGIIPAVRRRSRQSV